MRDYYFCYQTTIGYITIFANETAITKLHFGENIAIDAENIETEIIKKAALQLIEYLNGSRKIFDLNLEYTGTDFQLAVFDQIKCIPYGETKTYKEIAHKINHPKASLAIGGTCGKNPIPIFIPCHRVIGSNGSLIGYSGGINLKKTFLKIEKTLEQSFLFDI